MKPNLPPAAPFLASAVMALAMTLGCVGSSPETEPGSPDSPSSSHSPSPEPASSLGLGTPFVLQAKATTESLHGAGAVLVEPDGSRHPVAFRSVSFELRSDGQSAAIDRVRVELELLESAEPVAIANRTPTLLTVLDSSPDYVRATAGLAWGLEPKDRLRSGADGVPVELSLEAAAEGAHVRLTMTLESRAELASGDSRLITGPWVVQLEGDLMPR